MMGSRATKLKLVSVPAVVIWMAREPETRRGVGIEGVVRKRRGGEFEQGILGRWVLEITIRENDIDWGRGSSC